MVQVVWFKRDLRVRDHAPLARAAATGLPIVCLYVYEPDLLAQPEWDRSHSEFIDESLTDLDAGLRALGTRLTIRSGRLPDVLAGLAGSLAPWAGIAGLWSHEETGTMVTYDRDRRVASWCSDQGVPWTQIRQHGVVRRLGSRDGWARQWQRLMDEPQAPTPARLACVTSIASGWEFGARRDPGSLGVRGHLKASAQRGGESRAWDTLRSFLNARGVNYRADMASPITGETGCSRLSPYLAYGNISIRAVHQALQERRRELQTASGTDAGPRARTLPDPASDPGWLPSLTSFQSRLRWHCHFIQKLESEPEIEWRNMNRAYDGVRLEDPGAWDDEHRRRFDAWCAGRTGYPFVDACMRCLHETGWINFRMRAMLVSFASYHLWLHWKPTATFLARQFVDFEPGIHFCQFQMQSGVTGINTVRIYNPIKQGLDQDPEGAFTRRWVPELEHAGGKNVHEPWKGVVGVGLFDAADPGGGYPPPIVEHLAAYREAQRKIFAVRTTERARAEARRVYTKHGSRSSVRGRRPEQRS